MIELVAVLMLTAAMAVVVLPRLDVLSSMRGAAWRDQVLASLRHAQSVASSRRRLVCVTVVTGTVSVKVAATNPALSCLLELAGADGSPAWASDPQAPATTVSPGGTLYIQPSGRITMDGDRDSAALDRTIAIDGESSIVVVGETGHAE